MSRPRPILRVFSWIGCLLSGSALAQNPSPSRPDLPLDLNSDGRTDFVLSMNYSGFAPETPNKLRHLLKPSGSNQVWTVTASGQPATFEAPGDWSASNASEQQWAEALPVGSSCSNTTQVAGIPASVEALSAVTARWPAALPDSWITQPLPALWWSASERMPGGNWAGSN